MNATAHAPATEAPASPLARQTIDRVTAGLATGRVAGIAEIIQLVQALAANALEISVSDLAELIEKDVVVTTKVLAAANTLGYNPGAVGITSITQAIHVIGFNKVRMLALSLLLMENAERSLPEAAQKEASSLALCSGMLARGWAESHGRDDPERFFLCASLRNFGRILMTAFLAEDYQRARAVADAAGDGDQAYREVFGLTPLELGYELLRSSNLPEAMLATLKRFDPTILAREVLDPQAELATAAEFSVRLCELAMNPAIGPEAFARESQRLCATFGRHMRVAGDDLKELLGRTERNITAFGSAFGLQAIATGVAGRFGARRDGQGIGAAAGREPGGPGPAEAKPPEGVSGAPEAALSAPEAMTMRAEPGSTVLAGDAATTVATGAEPSVERPLVEWIHEALGTVGEAMGKPEVPFEEVVTIAARALLAGWGADEVVILIERGKGSFAVAGGVGPAWRQHKLKIGFRRDERSVLGVAATRAEPILIHDATDPKLAPYLPAWYRAGLGLFASVIVPAGEAGAVPALVMTGWKTRRKVHLAANEARAIKTLLGLIVTARRLAGAG